MAKILPGSQKDRVTVRPIAWITFLRGGPGHRALPLVVAAALCGCASARPPLGQPQATAASVGAAAAPGESFATIAAIRPIRAFPMAADDPHVAIMAAMGIQSSAASAGGALAEIIVRTDGGETLSVVQRNTAGLAPGERVVVLSGGSGLSLVQAPPQS